MMMVMTQVTAAWDYLSDQNYGYVRGNSYLGLLRLHFQEICRFRPRSANKALTMTIPLDRAGDIIVR